jgi:CheY-like chemotaxis protein
MPHGEMHVRGDTTRLAQAVGNLLNNAAKFTDQGGQITLCAICDEGQAVITVRDTGQGIPADMLTRVFDLFVQVNRATPAPHGGLGLGLALVRRLVDMHGGSVTAASPGLGLGTEVVIRLPLADSPATPTSSEPVDMPVATHVRQRRVLVVDDNKDAAEGLALLLKIQGHDVRVAYDGLEALDVGPAFKPDVVLLDLGMPRLNGCDTARRMRDEPWGQNVLLIALTGWGQAQDRARTTEAGFDLHLVKPVAEVDLTAALAQVDASLPKGYP